MAGTAFDQRRGRMIVVSRDYLDASTPPHTKWRLLARLPRAFDSFEYHPADDSFYGVSMPWGEGRHAIDRVAPDGAIEPSISLPPLPYEIGRPWRISFGDCFSR